MAVYDVTEEENSLLKQGVCPDCSSKEFLAGPCGGASQNFKCATCGSEFNICWPFCAERIDRLASQPVIAEESKEDNIDSRFDILDL